MICVYSSDITVILTELRIKLNLWLLYYGYAENIIKLMVHIDKSTKGQRGTIRQTTADAVCLPPRFSDAVDLCVGFEKIRGKCAHRDLCR